MSEEIPLDFRQTRLVAGPCPTYPNGLRRVGHDHAGDFISHQQMCRRSAANLELAARLFRTWEQR